MAFLQNSGGEKSTHALPLSIVRGRHILFKCTYYYIIAVLARCHAGELHAINKARNLSLTENPERFPYLELF